jgi:hypothetical protein
MIANPKRSCAEQQQIEFGIFGKKKKKKIIFWLRAVELAPEA